MKKSLNYWLGVITLVMGGALAQAEEITVSAAASLTNAFTDIARQFEAKQTDTKVLLNFGASGALLQQLEKGAPVDVFASADQDSMDQAQQKGLINPATRKDFVSNTLVVVVPVDSALSLKQLSDLTQSNVQKVAIGNPDSVPAGRYAKVALEKAGLWDQVAAKAVSTQNVRQSLDYVARAEVDAGFVYATDAQVMQNQVKKAFEVATTLPITYPIATTMKPANASAAEQFVQYVLSPEGQRILQGYGFQKP